MTGLENAWAVLERAFVAAPPERRQELQTVIEAVLPHARRLGVLLDGEIGAGIKEVAVVTMFAAGLGIDRAIRQSRAAMERAAPTVGAIVLRVLA